MAKETWRAAFLAFALACGAAAGDEVHLRNGDRLTGVVAAKSAGTLSLRTEYAGELAIRWSDVVSITTHGAVQLLLRGETEPLRATLQALPGGGARLVDANGAVREVALEDIAYVNPKPHESGRGTSYSGRAALSAAYASGNADSERLYGDAEFSARAKAYRYGFSGRIDRRSDTALGTSSAWLLGANYDRFLDAARFGYVRGSMEHDRSKDIRRRSAAGAGFGVQLLDTPAARLTLRAGPDYVVLDRLAGEGERYPAFGWGAKATFAPWGPRAEIFHEQEGFLTLEDSKSVLVRSKTGVRVPLVNRFNATAQLNVDWERTPAPGRAATDRTLLFGLDYSF